MPLPESNAERKLMLQHCGMFWEQARAGNDVTVPTCQLEGVIHQQVLFPADPALLQRPRCPAQWLHPPPSSMSQASGLYWMRDQASPTHVTASPCMQKITLRESL